jgi:GrpB-like predicted nucleotidyltransferase (UPF0157 family)
LAIQIRANSEDVRDNTTFAILQMLVEARRDLVDTPLIAVMAKIGEGEGLSVERDLCGAKSELRRENLLVRDYLRTHPEEVQQYATIKHEAVHVSPSSLLGYQEHKRAYMQELKEGASLATGSKPWLSAN